MLTVYQHLIQDKTQVKRVAERYEPGAGRVRVGGTRQRLTPRRSIDTFGLISGLFAPAGAPARLIVRWLAGDFELIVSEQLLAELSRALAYPKLRSRITAEEARAFVQLLRRSTTASADPPGGPWRSRDPGDDYLLALASSSAAVLVSGDRDLLVLAPGLPICSASDFLSRLDT